MTFKGMDDPAFKRLTPEEQGIAIAASLARAPAPAPADAGPEGPGAAPAQAQAPPKRKLVKIFIMDDDAELLADYLAKIRHRENMPWDSPLGMAFDKLVVMLELGIARAKVRDAAGAASLSPGQGPDGGPAQ